MSKIAIKIILLTVFLAANVSWGLNKTLLETCKSTFYTCVENLAISNVSETLGTCSAPFDACIGKLLEVSPPWPLECFQSEAAWTNFYVSIGAFFGILAFNNLVVPAALKGVAWSITKCMQADAEAHPHIQRVGKFVGDIFFDENRDGQVTASEIYTPQSFITFAGLSFPVYYLFQALNQQAHCDFARTAMKCAIPGFDDDDFCHDS